MSWVATAVVVSTVGSSLISSKGARDAGRDVKDATALGVEEQRRQYDQTRQDFAPWREQGGNALSRLGRASEGDMSDFNKSPGYQFRLDEGTRNMENRFSATGGGGNAMRALNEYSQNFASNEFGNWWNRQAGLSGVGQTATGQTAAAGANAANNISGQYGAQGSDLGSIGLWDSANQSNALQGGISNLLYGLKKKKKKPTVIGGA